jgi:hypothetical protein
MNLPSYMLLDIRDLWQARDLPQASGSLNVEVKPHAVMLLRVTPARSRQGARAGV